MTNVVRAGNMLNRLIVSQEPFVARVAIWVAYYPLMRALGRELERFERTIEKRYEPVESEPPPEGWVQSTAIE